MSQQVYNIALNIRGAQFSGIGVLKTFSGNNIRVPKIPLASIRYSKISQSLIFEVRCQTAKNAKMMRLENLALYMLVCFGFVWLCC